MNEFCILIKQHYLCKHIYECMDYDNFIHKCKKCDKWDGIYNRDNSFIQDLFLLFRLKNPK